MPLRQPHARFAVIGQPVDHSLSPYIHRAFARQWSVDLDYGCIELMPDDLAIGI
ncbi:MAG: shikimate dehydrogenase, partial [Arenimonas sp.]